MNEEDTGRYQCSSSLWERKYTLRDAAAHGWNKTIAGLHALRQLPVGGTCTDDDGDTWERVQ